MDYELIFWVVAPIVSIAFTLWLVNRNTDYNNDPYRYCPKEEEQ